MAIKTFRARTTTDALRMVKQEYGEHAVVLHTRTVKRTGVLGIATKPTVEITASNNTKEQLVKMAQDAKKKHSETTNALSSPSTESITEHHARQKTNVQVAPSGTGLYTPHSQPVPSALTQHHTSVPVTPRKAANAPQESPTNRAPLYSPAVVGRDVSSCAQSPDETNIQSELRSMRSVLASLVASNRARSAREMVGVAFDTITNTCDSAQRHYLQMIESAVAEDIAYEVLQRAVATLNSHERMSESAVSASVRRELAALIPASSETKTISATKALCPRVLAFVGPTGVGKTTTVAKLAATYALREKSRVGLLTVDTYRIAAVDQLRTYADIIGVPLAVAQTPNDVRHALSQFSTCDVLLIDTAGRAPRDAERIEELRALLDAAHPDEVHLVLSATASQSSLDHAAECFAPLQPDRIVFTKLDEAVNFGVLINTAKRVKLELSYLSDGQEVPDRLVRGGAEMLADLILSQNDS